MERPKQNAPDLAWLSDPEVFAVGRTAPHAWPSFSLGQNHRSLNGQWHARFFETPQQALAALPMEEVGAESPVQVPGHLQLQGFGRPQYVNTMYPWDGLEALTPPGIPSDNPTALYRREVYLSAQEAEGFVSVCFHGVESSVFLWLNGQFVGYAEDSFTPSEFEVSHLVRAGQNTLYAMTPRYCTGSWLEDQDFWRFSGIFREVELITAPLTRMLDVRTHQRFAEDFSSVQLDVEVRMTGGGLVSALLRAPGGDPVSQASLAVADNAAQGSLRVDMPSLWSAETPSLYMLELTLSAQEGALMQACNLRIGFRHIEIREAQVRLNGRRLLLRGVNRHEFGHLVGRAITKEMIAEDILLLKRNNFNAVRTSHYPNQAWLYHLCDQYGLYVIDETNLETHGTWMVQGTIIRGANMLPGDKPEWREAVLDRAASMYERDKNHACVISWSCGNESCGGSTLHAMAAYFRGKGDGRFVHYEGIFFDRRFDDTSDVESQMYTRPAEAERYLCEQPQKPFLLCEYAHAMGNSFGGVQLYTTLEKYPQYLGGFIWDWSDQLLACAPGDPAYTGLAFRKPTDGYFCANGLLFADHTPTPKLQEAKALYAPLLLACEVGGVAIINRHAFLSTAKYAFVWRLLCDGESVQAGRFALDVPPGGSATRSLDYALPPAGECVLECAAVLTEDAPWAPAGHEIAFGQTTLRPFSCPKPVTLASLVLGDCNTGARLTHSFALISATTGRLTSWTVDGAELFAEDLRPEFWRAPTDNDIGAGMPIFWGGWKIASLYQGLKSYAADPKRAEIAAAMTLAGRDELCGLRYRFLRPDILEVVMSLDVRADMPCFGVSFALAREYDRLRWYGNLQPEAYCDRQNGARIGIGSGLVEKQYVPYANPQENANKTQLRWLEITNAAGRGLRVFAPEAFEASVLPYTAHELEAARHQENLPPYRQNVVRLMKGQCGVGGDNSWGAHAHPQYRFIAEGKTEFVFYLQAGCWNQSNP